jgi:DNA repair exonuclease SbcCD ATPase subunit
LINLFYKYLQAKKNHRMNTTKEAADQNAILNSVGSLEKNFSGLQDENKKLNDTIKALQTQLNSLSDELSNFKKAYLAHKHVYSEPNIGLLKAVLPDYPQGVALGMWGTGVVDSAKSLTSIPASTI